jgi:hypothetical protein
VFTQVSPASSQVSVVQRLLSEQLWVVVTQPVAGTQLSSVQNSVSSQTTGVVAQTVVEPVAGSQLSLVHALLSLQTTGVTTHPVAGSHVSVVQSRPSLQTTGVKTHPVAGSHVSIVHALPSLHVSGVPGLQPDTVVVEAVNCTWFGVVLHPVGLALQVSWTLIVAWSFRVVGSVGTTV